MPTRFPTHRLAPVGRRVVDKMKRTDKRFYARAAWRRSRIAFLSRNPLCEDCRQYKRLTPATEAHHVDKRSDAPERSFDHSNLMALCSSCHAKRTRRGE